MDELVCSVARQWQKFGGCAGLFVEDRQLVTVLTEKPDGGSSTDTWWIDVEIKAALRSLGFPDEAIPEVIARINCGQEIEFRDKNGVATLLWHDPKQRKLITERLASQPASPLFCPHCTGLLNPWRPGEKQQTCRHCGRVSTAGREQ